MRAEKTRIGSALRPPRPACTKKRPFSESSSSKNGDATLDHLGGVVRLHPHDAELAAAVLVARAHEPGLAGLPEEVGAAATDVHGAVAVDEVAALDVRDGDVGPAGQVLRLEVDRRGRLCGHHQRRTEQGGSGGRQNEGAESGGHVGGSRKVHGEVLVRSTVSDVPEKSLVVVSCPASETASLTALARTYPVRMTTPHDATRCARAVAGTRDDPAHVVPVRTHAP